MYKRQELEWKADRELLSVSGDGLVTPAVNAGWIQEAMKKYPYSAQKTTTAVVGSGDKKKDCLLYTSIWPLARPCAWDLGSACFMERGSFSGMRGFLAEYAQGDVYYGRY